MPTHTPGAPPLLDLGLRILTSNISMDEGIYSLEKIKSAIAFGKLFRGNAEESFPSLPEILYACFSFRLIETHSAASKLSSNMLFSCW